MSYVVKPSTFGVGYSIFRLEVTETGERVESYLGETPSVEVAKIMYPGAKIFVCPTEEAESNSKRQFYLASA